MVSFCEAETGTATLTPTLQEGNKQEPEAKSSERSSHPTEHFGGFDGAAARAVEWPRLSEELNAPSTR